MDYINRLKIKTSDTQEMKMIFTAQSKYYFFCRDVICEFVMKQGLLPINPFRVFDYFLGDRVDRNLVRRGNNQLIRICDELWVFGNIADGVLFEIISAIEQHKPIHFFTIGSELGDIKEIPVEKITFEPEVHAAKIKKQDLINFIKTGEVNETENDLNGQITLFDVGDKRIDNIMEREMPRCTTDSPISNESSEYDVAVIGLGSSGMLAFKYLLDHGIKVIGIEKGKDPNNRTESACDIASGFGGSGLFSDGKLSFYPAGSSLWMNALKPKIKAAYGTVKDLLEEVGCDIPSWNDRWEKKYEILSSINEKEYESIYFDQIQSRKFINNIYEKYKSNMMLNTRPKIIKYYNNGFNIELTNNEFVRAKRLLVATGKLGNSLLYHIDSNIAFFHKYELGVRLETESENFIPFELNQVDYKLIKKNKNIEIRTFCCCKNGRVLESYYDDVLEDIDKGRYFRSFNGGISEEQTGRSNIGILVRCEDTNSTLIKEFRCFLETFLEQKGLNSGTISLQEFREAIRNEGEQIIGAESDNLINDFVSKIIKSDDIKYDTKIYLPEIEYYGKYPLFDWDNLKVSNKNIWIAGDVSGSFRGLLPSLISGIYAAMSIVQEMSV